MEDNRYYVPLKCDGCGAPLTDDYTGLHCEYCGTKYHKTERYLGPKIPEFRIINPLSLSSSDYPLFSNQAFSNIISTSCSSAVDWKRQYHLVFDGGGNYD